MKRSILPVRDIDEKILLSKLIVLIQESYPELNPKNTLVLMVSPDYSATVAMHVAHALSKDGEMCDILPINVPYPDEQVDIYLTKAMKDLDAWFEFSETEYENYLLVEAGVIRGGTYTWLTNMLSKKVVGNIITCSLYENKGSKFKSNIVAEYYDDTVEDLTFYFERENKHWN
jgi:hypothetical protein